MRFKREEIAGMAVLILKNLKEGGLIQPQAAEEKILAAVESVVFQNLEEETAIEDEVKKIMEQYRSQIASGSVDPQKIYMMIKKQVAKERKFVL